MKRTLAIGDIHGCLTALETLLAWVAPTIEDRIITLGDYIDRGPDSCGVIERLRQLQDECHLVTLRGNHDVMLLTARKEGFLYNMQWKQVGGDATLASYGGKLSGIPDTHWRFFENTLPFYETATHIFVHATVDAETPLTEQNEGTLYWQKLWNPDPHFSGKTVVCGHTSQKNGLPLDFNHTICIDTFAYGGGWLSCLNVADGRIYQANQQGEKRLLWRDELPVASD